DCGVAQDVARGGTVTAEPGIADRRDVGAVEDSAPATGVDHGKLTPPQSRVALLEFLDCRLGRGSVPQALEDPGAKPGVGAMLRQDGPHIAWRPGAAAADRHGRGRDDGAQHSGPGTATCDRECHDTSASVRRNSKVRHNAPPLSRSTWRSGKKPLR